MSGDEVNPAAVAQPVEDVQGDGRWMSQVGGVCLCVYLNVFIVYLSNQNHYAIIRLSAFLWCSCGGKTHMGYIWVFMHCTFFFTKYSILIS